MIRHINLNDNLRQDHYAKFQGNKEQMNDAFSSNESYHNF